MEALEIPQAVAAFCPVLQLLQNEIHPYYQENDIIPYIQELGIVVQGWYPLGGRGHTAELLGDEVITEIANVHGKSPAQVILRWNLQKGVVVIPGSSNPAHMNIPPIRVHRYLFEIRQSEKRIRFLIGIRNRSTLHINRSGVKCQNSA